ncbi:Peptidase M2 peptidyl-dipeptidase A [Trinorchestia longiramus]|nr:Peptidase M2 peptidyl-dipeptidase A [Trinorchestia longiramus]
MSFVTFFIIVLLTVLHYIIDFNTLSVPEFLSEYDSRISALSNAAVLTEWTWSTNITSANQRIMDEAVAREAAYQAEAYSKARWFLKAHKRKDISLSYDQFRQISKVGRASLKEPDLTLLAEVRANISGTYSKAYVEWPVDLMVNVKKNETKLKMLESSSYDEQQQHWTNWREQEETRKLKLEPDLTTIMAEVRNHDLLREIWKEWREQVGRKVRPHIKDLVALQNKEARLNGYSDHGAFWRGKYETKGFEDQIKRLNDQLTPLYRTIHAYVRHKLMITYSDKDIFRDGMIPACVLGDMWGRYGEGMCGAGMVRGCVGQVWFWTDIYDIVEPYPSATSVDPTPQMQELNMTVRGMYELADAFYQSMGLKPLPKDFYKLSMLERPNDGRDVECHGTAWDFLDGKDFRIRMCTQVNFKYLEVIHHELGHIQYFMQYAHLPLVYRDGANDGFHEGVGELMGMTLATVNHLISIGLLPDVPQSKESTINFLMRTALKTVTTLPFHYVNDLWRWEVFRGDVPENRWNARYWQLKKQYMGVMPPVNRTEEHLDAFNIFHVNNDFDMIRYFTRTVLQFQFAGALCRIADFEGPLHDCDFSSSKAAGEKLAAMLSLGSSRPWMDALEQLTGGRTMDAGPILHYFQPLRDWLDNYLQEHGLTPGWNP